MASGLYFRSSEFTIPQTVTAPIMMPLFSGAGANSFVRFNIPAFPITRESNSGLGITEKPPQVNKIVPFPFLRIAGKTA